MWDGFSTSEPGKLTGFRLYLKIFFGRNSTGRMGLPVDFYVLAFSTLKIGAMNVYLFPTFCFIGMLLG